MNAVLVMLGWAGVEWLFGVLGRSDGVGGFLDPVQVLIFRGSWVGVPPYTSIFRQFPKLYTCNVGNLARLIEGRAFGQKPMLLLYLSNRAVLRLRVACRASVERVRSCRGERP